MPSTADGPGDPGLAGERTALAWQRVALSFTSLAALTLGAAAHRQSGWLLVPAALLFGAAAAVWRYARRRTGGAARGTDPVVLRWLVAATAGAALVAALLAVVRPH